MQQQLPNGYTSITKQGETVHVIGELPLTYDATDNLLAPAPITDPFGSYINTSYPEAVRIQRTPGSAIRGVFIRDQLRTRDLTPQDRPFTGGYLADMWVIQFPYEGPGYQPYPGSTADLGYADPSGFGNESTLP